MSLRPVLELRGASTAVVAEPQGLSVTRGQAMMSMGDLLGSAQVGEWQGPFCIRLGTLPKTTLGGIESARLREMPESAFYGVPKLLRELGVPSWVRGVVVEDGQVTLWVDLSKVEAIRPSVAEGVV